MKRVFSMTLEWWNTVFQVASALLLGLTFAVGTGAIITGVILGKRQEERIAMTGRDTAEANKRAGEANERATKLELEASQQRERAAKAEHDLFELQQRLAWRRIGPREHSAFVATLKPFAGSTVEITKLGDFEAGQFADDIIRVFAETKWNVRLITIGIGSPPTYGLLCSINDGSSAGKALAAIVGTLQTARIESAPKLPIVARIYVGLKPPP